MPCAPLPRCATWVWRRTARGIPRSTCAATCCSDPVRSARPRSLRAWPCCLPCGRPWPCSRVLPRTACSLPTWRSRRCCWAASCCSTPWRCGSTPQCCAASPASPSRCRCSSSWWRWPASCCRGPWTCSQGWACRPRACCRAASPGSTRCSDSWARPSATSLGRTPSSSACPSWRRRCCCCCTPTRCRSIGCAACRAGSRASAWPRRRSVRRSSCSRACGWQTCSIWPSRGRRGTWARASTPAWPAARRRPSRSTARTTSLRSSRRSCCPTRWACSWRTAWWPGARAAPSRRPTASSTALPPRDMWTRRRFPGSASATSTAAAVPRFGISPCAPSATMCPFRTPSPRASSRSRSA